MYRKVLEALDEACVRLGGGPAEGPDERAAERGGTFHLGTAGGLAFSGHLPGIESDALFDDISAAAAARDLGRVDRIRRRVAARLRSDAPTDEPGGGDGLDWAAGLLQMLAVLNEARRARAERDVSRHSLLMGFLVGLMHWEPGLRYERGSLRDAVIAAHARDRGPARRWVDAESIRERRDESADADERVLLLGWVGDRLAAGHRLSGPLFFHAEGETEREREEREARERAYFEREETSARRAQNFGRRVAGEDAQGVWLPASYAVNRALVLGSHPKP